MAESRAAPGPDTPMLSRLTRRGFLKAGGALVVGLTVAGARRAAAHAAGSGAPASPRPAWPTDRLCRPRGDLVTVDGVIQPKAGGPGVSYGELVGERRIGLPIDPKAPLKAPKDFRHIGQSVPRPDIPAKVTGRNQYVQDVKLP